MESTSIRNPQKSNKDIEKLFVNVAKIIDFSHKNGFCQLELFEEEKTDFVYEILNLGIKLMKHGAVPNFYNFKINLKIQKFLRDNQVNDELLERILLVKELIPILSSHDADYLLEFSSYFCCSETRHKLNLFLNDYKKNKIL